VIGEALNRRRLLLALTVDQVGAVLGVDRLTWLNWETGIEPIQHPEQLGEVLDAIEVFRQRRARSAAVPRKADGSLTGEFDAVVGRTAAGRTPIGDLGAWCAANVERVRASEDASLRQAVLVAIVLVYAFEHGRASAPATRAALAGLARRDDRLGR
jgi:hypothetical protein